MYKPTVIHIEDPSSYNRRVMQYEDLSSHGLILLRDEKHSWSVLGQTQDLFSARTSMESLILAQDERWRCA